jgi:hypothetical protein
MKYKVGDRVKVKPRKWFSKLEETDGMRMTPGGECLMDYHMSAAGLETVVTGTVGKDPFSGKDTSLYGLRGHSYLFPEEILDPVGKPK